MTDTCLTHHTFSDCLWIRCTSRGSFVNSPTLKSLADKYLEQGGKNLVIDLEMCSGIDSTFMGTMAGLANRCLSAGGSLQVASPTDRTRQAMESLGLDMLVDIDPPDAFWHADLEERRRELADDAHSSEGTGGTPMSEVARTRHVLEAHNTLRSMNHKNAETFGYVCETLEEDLMRHGDEH